jgi:hypothetical protein
VEIGRLDKPEAIHLLPPSGGGGRGLTGRKKAIDGGERGLPSNLAAKRLNNYTPALKRPDITIYRALRRTANPITVRGHSLQQLSTSSLPDKLVDHQIDGGKL